MSVSSSGISNLILAVTLLTIVSPTALAQETVDQIPLITASGTSELRMSPDLAVVRLGVETEAVTAARAREQNAARVTAAIQVLKALQIPEAAITTTTFQLEAVRRWDEPRTSPGLPPIVGYRVSNIVSVRTPQLDLVPRIIDDSIAAGANRVDGVSFTLEDDSPHKQSALRQAVAEARAKAQTMAQEIGVKLVRVHRLQESGVGIVPPPIVFAAREGGVSDTTPTPVLPGEVTVRASVTLAYVIQ